MQSHVLHKLITLIYNKLTYFSTNLQNNEKKKNICI